MVHNISAAMGPPFLAAIEQVACAVRFARSTAVDYGGDPARITLLGSSAGAWTGVIVGMAGDDFETDRCVVTEGSALINALVGYEGPYDHTLRAYGPFDLTTLKPEDPEHWEAINTYSHIGGNPDLVVRLVHGRDNDVAWYDVVPEVSVELHDATTEAGYDVGLTFVEGASHVDLLSTTEAYEVAVEQVLEVARG